MQGSLKNRHTLILSTIYHLLFSPRYATSPVFNHPSSVIVAAVSFGLPQYPFIIFGPRSQISPRHPGRVSSVPSSNINFADVPGNSSPTAIDDSPDASESSQQVAQTGYLLQSACPVFIHEQPYSVNPHACLTLTFPFQISSNCCVTSMPNGAAPASTLLTLLRS
jgi:hypothetical protein